MSIKPVAVSLVVMTALLSILVSYQGSSYSNNLVSEKFKVYPLFEEWLIQHPKQYQSNHEVSVL